MTRRLPQRLTNSGIATTRSTVTAAYTGAAIYAITHLTGWNIDADDPLVIAVFAGALTIVHRISTVLVEIWPPLGYILFGIPRQPVYPPPPPPSTPPAATTATVRADTPNPPEEARRP